MRYRAVATSVEGFIQQIACCYLRHGYWFYVAGRVPHGKDPTLVDRKLIEKYGIGMSESTRARRKMNGQANLQYIRHEQFFVILATKGKHTFFEAEQDLVRDIRLHQLPPRGTNPHWGTRPQMAFACCYGPKSILGIAVMVFRASAAGLERVVGSGDLRLASRTVRASASAVVDVAAGGQPGTKLGGKNTDSGRCAAAAEEGGASV